MGVHSEDQCADGQGDCLDQRDVGEDHLDEQYWQGMKRCCQVKVLIQVGEDVEQVAGYG